MKIAQIPTRWWQFLQSKLWLTLCRSRRIWAPLLGFGTNTILWETCHWQKPILYIKNMSIAKIHTSKLQKPQVVGSWERWPTTLSSSNMSLKIYWNNLGGIVPLPWPSEICARPTTWKWTWCKLWQIMKPCPLVTMNDFM